MLTSKNLPHPRKTFDPDTGKQIKKCSRRSTINRRHIKVITKDDFEYTLHATKGWRKKRVIS